MIQKEANVYLEILKKFQKKLSNVSGCLVSSAYSIGFAMATSLERAMKVRKTFHSETSYCKSLTASLNENIRPWNCVILR